MAANRQTYFHPPHGDDEWWEMSDNNFDFLKNTTNHLEEVSTLSQSLRLQPLAENVTHSGLAFR